MPIKLINQMFSCKPVYLVPKNRHITSFFANPFVVRHNWTHTLFSSKIIWDSSKVDPQKDSNKPACDTLMEPRNVQANPFVVSRKWTYTIYVFLRMQYVVAMAPTKFFWRNQNVVLGLVTERSYKMVLQKTVWATRNISQALSWTRKIFPKIF